MKVSSDYYKTGFANPEACERIVQYCRQVISISGRPYTPEALVAKRLQSIISKHYKLSENSSARLHSTWERNPQEFIDWFLTLDPTGKARIRRKDVNGPWHPANMELKFPAESTIRIKL